MRDGPLYYHGYLLLSAYDFPVHDALIIVALISLLFFPINTFIDVDLLFCVPCHIWKLLFCLDIGPPASLPTFKRHYSLHIAPLAFHHYV